ncbi:MAG: hypothetical protein VYA30_13515 [Myxococcota bacterium]|nr:hypothetical protein [Myxococcota bacterium]
MRFIIRLAVFILVAAQAVAAPPVGAVLDVGPADGSERVCVSCVPSTRVDKAPSLPVIQSACSECHSNKRQPLVGPVQPHSSPALETFRRTPGIQFNHELHIQTIACGGCHAPTNEGQLATPLMQQCMDCHTENKMNNRCDLCHQTGAGGVLKTRLGLHTLRPTQRILPDVFHHTDFKTNHGLQARTHSQTCQNCHTPDECTTCHQMETRIGVHQGDYIRFHPVEARHDPTSCSSCHQPTTFCRDCHSRAGLSPAPGPRQFGRTDGRLKFHPPGFTDLPGTARGAQHHAFAAQKDLSSCATCHSPNDCVRCHSTNAPLSLRASPHPKRFRCGKALEVSANGCRTCHTDILSLRIRCQALGN